LTDLNVVLFNDLLEGLNMAKSSGSKVSSLAGKTLGSDGASKIQKSLAGSALAQSGTSKVTSKAMETKASGALQSEKSNAVTKSLAGSVVAQSKKNP
jgi:hypothetical protein